MTANQYAKSRVKKHHYIIKEWSWESDWAIKQCAIQCAILEVNEMLKLLKDIRKPEYTAILLTAKWRYTFEESEITAEDIIWFYKQVKAELKTILKLAE